MPTNYTMTGARLSHCERFRYLLTREWDDSLPSCAFIGLNPSTADDKKDDPTIRRCVNFAASWGYGKLYMLNIHPFRATEPKDLFANFEQPSDVWMQNEEVAEEVAAEVQIAIAAWGSNIKRFPEFAWPFTEVFAGKLHCLSLTKDGYPGHPLYLKGNLKPQPFLGASV